MPDRPRSSHQPHRHVAARRCERHRQRRLDREHGSLEVQASRELRDRLLAAVSLVNQHRKRPGRGSNLGDLETGRERAEVDELVLEGRARRRSSYQRGRRAGQGDEETSGRDGRECSLMVHERERRLPPKRRVPPAASPTPSPVAVPAHAPTLRHRHRACPIGRARRAFLPRPDAPAHPADIGGHLRPACRLSEPKVLEARGIRTTSSNRGTPSQPSVGMSNPADIDRLGGTEPTKRKS